MALADAAQHLVSGLAPVCVLAAAMEMLLQDDGSSLGFRTICGLAVALSALRSIINWLG